MESFQILQAQSIERLKVADHLVDTTYSMVQEPKLLVSVIENISVALELAITALIEYEKQSKIIPSYTSTFDGKLEIFRRKIMTTYDLPNEMLNFILNVKHAADEHKTSSVEFRKKDTYVISDNDYNLIKLDIDNVKKTLQKAKYTTNHLFKLIVEP
jgi:hypothetical protein